MNNKIISVIIICEPGSENDNDMQYYNTMWHGVIYIQYITLTLYIQYPSIPILLDTFYPFSVC